jgi:drug/metabolite transporter (DMT)-like permease
MLKTAPTAYTKTDRPGAIAVAAGAAIWGLFWLPLRFLQDAGMSGLWGVALVMAAAVLPALVTMHRQRESAELLRIDSWLIGSALGLSSVLYFAGVLYSDVIRVIFLFYLLPLWTTLSARLIYGQPIRRAQLMVIGAALVGVWLLLGGGTSLPWPRNVGDWCGISAGLCWGVCLSLLRGRDHTPPFASTACTILVALVLSSCAATLISLGGTAAGATALPGNDVVQPFSLALAGIFGALVLFPALLSQIWGARRIPSPTAALLTMTEILVATVSAGLLIGTETEPVAWLGGMLILIAVCIDLLTTRAER